MSRLARCCSRAYQRLCAGVVLSVLLGLLAPAAAFAAPTLGVGVVDYGAGTITLRVTLDAPIATVVFVGTDGTAFDTVPVAHEPGVIESAPTSVAAKGTFTAVGIDAAGKVSWARTLGLDPVSYIPAVTSTFRPLANGVVKSTTKVSGIASRPATKITVTVAGRSRVVTQSASTVVSVTGIHVPTGSAKLGIRLGNGFGVSAVNTRTVWQLAADDLVGRARYCVIDKATFWQYFVSNGRVARRWPVAIGMSSTPTPRGTFYVGAAVPGGGDWGVLRRPLSRRTATGKYVRTRYYVHGTNDPLSIGTMASHGCVRMFNSGIRDHAKRVPTGTLIRIR